MTEQTRDWERGERARIIAGLRAYSKWAGALMLVAVPVFFVAMPWLIRIVFGEDYAGATHAARIVLVAAAIHFVLGWTKSLPVTIGRPRATHRHARARDPGGDPAGRGPGRRVGCDRRRRGRARLDTRVRSSVAGRGRASARRGGGRAGCRCSREGRRRVRDLAARSRRAGEPCSCARRLPRGAGARGRGRHDRGFGAGARAPIPSRGRRGARRCDTLGPRRSFVGRRGGRTPSTRRA